MPPIMMPPNFSGHGPMMATHFDHQMSGATLTPMASAAGLLGGPNPFPGGFATISEPVLTQATSSASLLKFDETEKKNKARIELLEKKIKVKD